MRFTIWIKILLANKIQFNSKSVLQVFSLTFITCIFTPFIIFETIYFYFKGRKITVDKSPIFIIGHWRSGTTYIHHLTCLDKNFDYVTTFQATCSEIFLTLGNIFEPFFKELLPEKRIMDDVKIYSEQPFEEEFGIRELSPFSFYYSWSFPKNMETYFDKYVIFENSDEKTIKKWKETYLYLLKKITLASHGKRLLLKNPINTGRLDLILEMFPDAKFIHIYRNPYNVYCSTLRLFEKQQSRYNFQSVSQDENSNYILIFYQKIFEKFFKDKEKIPVGNLVEVRYEDFIEDPLNELERIYKTLKLPDFNESKSLFRDYVSKASDFKVHKYELDDELRKKIYEKWKFTIDRWDY